MSFKVLRWWCVKSSAGDIESSARDVKSSAGYAKSSAEDVMSSAGDLKSSAEYESQALKM